MTKRDLVLELGADAEKKDLDQIVAEYEQTKVLAQSNSISLRNSSSPPRFPNTLFSSPVIDLTMKLGLGDPERLSSLQRTKGFVHNTIIDLTMDSNDEDVMKPIKYKKSKKECKILQKKTWKYSMAELEAFPAVIFPKFGSLPRELQYMTWTFALTQPIIIECIYRSDLQQFWAHGSKKSILECCPLDPSEFNLHPIYLHPCVGRKKLSSPRAKIPVQNLTFDPIYIGPGDIIYLPEIYNIDVNSFLAEKENHLIENLAIHASSALRLKVASQVWRHTIPEGKLIGGLRNLKTIHIVDGKILGSEMSSKHMGNYRLTLAEVKKSDEIGTTNSKKDFIRKAQYPWNSGVVDSIRGVWMTQILSDRQRHWWTGLWNWNVPQLFFHELKRELIAMTHLRRSPTDLKFL
jgi:hypothetical protein